VIYTGDPLTPAALTKEATAQDYHPEWIVGPTVLADTTFFGRTFDQDDRRIERVERAHQHPRRARAMVTDAEDGDFTHGSCCRCETT